MSAPRIKIFDAEGRYQASTHDYAAAGALMGLYGDGATGACRSTEADPGCTVDIYASEALRTS